MLRNKFLVIILILLISLTYFNVTSTATTRVEPSRIIINSSLDTRNTGIINVINTGDEQILLQAYLFDWDLESRGGLETYEPGTLDSSLEGLIKFNPRSFILEPGQSQVVRFTITTPEEINRELRGVVFFENQTDFVYEETGSRLVTQVGTIIYLIPDKVEYKFKMLEVRFANPEDEHPDSCMIVMRNDGNAHIRFKIDYKIINEKRQLIEEGFVEENVILPNLIKRVIIPFKNKLDSGDYKLILKYKFINNEKESNFEVPFFVE